MHNKLTKKTNRFLLPVKTEETKGYYKQYFRGTTLLHSLRMHSFQMPLHPALNNVKPTFKSYQPDHSTISSNFNLSCLAPTDNSLRKISLLLLRFSVFCVHIITSYFHDCKHFLTFIFRKY